MHIDDEVNAGIAKASAAFGPLRGSIWAEHTHLNQLDKMILMSTHNIHFHDKISLKYL